MQLVGRQPPEVVRSYLQQADAFLLSSLSEGIANAALEAMACGIPVVTSDCGGMREAITHGVEGFVTPLRQPEAMAQALQRLWQDPELRRQMGEHGRARVLADFNLEKQVSQFLDLFEQARSARDEPFMKIFTDPTLITQERRPYMADILRPYFNVRTPQQNLAIYGPNMSLHQVVEVSAASRCGRAAPELECLSPERRNHPGAALYRAGTARWQTGSGMG